MDAASGVCEVSSFFRKRSYGHSTNLDCLFDAPVAHCLAAAEMYDEPLFEEEARALMRALPKRRREFAAGRAAARRALGEFGVSPVPIPARQDRTPAWPPGFVGSISHCPDRCVAVVARCGATIGLGIDVEEDTPLPAAIRRMVCTETELSMSPALGVDVGKLLFCAKEAFYKCYYPVTKAFLDFSDVTITLFAPDASGVGRFSVTLINLGKPPLPQRSRWTGRWFRSDRHIFAAVTALKVVAAPCDDRLAASAPI